MKSKMMIGRYQPWHKGHQWLLDELLEDESEGVWIGVRSCPVDERNPYHTVDVINNIKRWLREHKPAECSRVIVTSIPDISGVHYGRGVGWSIVEHIPPADIGKVSATEIRNEAIHTRPDLDADTVKEDWARPSGPMSDGTGQHIQRDSDSGD